MYICKQVKHIWTVAYSLYDEKLLTKGVTYQQFLKYFSFLIGTIKDNDLFRRL